MPQTPTRQTRFTFIRIRNLDNFCGKSAHYMGLWVCVYPKAGVAMKRWINSAMGRALVVGTSVCAVVALAACSPAGVDSTVKNNNGSGGANAQGGTTGQNTAGNGK